eukprot:gnl/MRDRNA2_/MRDRNA2_219096_c0_seq1.p2 gnl/MRDRNA2_/MRDRNA2_219096_c0~~gnl/MRDRNA2_/MRDRNA2_219096_c0_seq1.p2  ORF type:complete len:116 (-),score=17.92 gnl/MRDRNA2_/MRDRNA2_219096_c0_seq1:54-401(-)
MNYAGSFEISTTRRKQAGTNETYKGTGTRLLNTCSLNEVQDHWLENETDSSLSSDKCTTKEMPTQSHHIVVSESQFVAQGRKSVSLPPGGVLLDSVFESCPCVTTLAGEAKGLCQ